MAFERNASSAISAAAKRYCCVAPRLAPSRKVPKQNHSKLLRKIAQVAITAPTPPIAVPSQKPGRRGRVAWRRREGGRRHRGRAVRPHAAHERVPLRPWRALAHEEVVLVDL